MSSIERLRAWIEGLPDLGRLDPRRIDLEGLRGRINLRVLSDTEHRWDRYLVVAGTANAVIWGTALLHLVVTRPSYTSTWALILPSANSAVKVNLPGIGQAESSSAGGGGTTYDTRANYEYIFTSEPVLNDAARRAGLEPAAFGKPRIKLLDNTTLMQFEMSGPSPQLAQRKSVALFAAATERLNQLREGEMREREGPSQRILLSAQSKLAEAQRRVSAFKLSSGLSSTDQVSDLSSNIEQLRRQRAEVAAQAELAAKRRLQLGRDLGLTPAQAAEAFQLQVDPIFQQNQRDYSEATASLKVLLAKFGLNHPRVVKERKRQQAAQAGMLRRSGQLLGRPLPLSVLARLGLASNGTGRDILFQNLITYQTDERGLLGQRQALDGQIGQLERRLQDLSQRQSKLENLKRDEQIAEAVFASTLTKLDLGQGDLFTAFPLVQMAVEPSLPIKPSAPKRGFVLAGAFVGSLLSTTGLWILWIRKPWVKKLNVWLSS
jgi:uncharacterized protein involved in exopolysaccharide biosynthesis